MIFVVSDDVLQHHGILGQKWGIRRYQNPDGTLTDAGKKRYGVNNEGGPTGKQISKRLNDTERMIAFAGKHYGDSRRSLKKINKKLNRRKGLSRRDVKKRDNLMKENADSKKIIDDGKAEIDKMLRGIDYDKFSLKSKKTITLVNEGREMINAALLGGLISIPLSTLTAGAGLAVRPAISSVATIATSRYMPTTQYKVKEREQKR